MNVTCRILLALAATSAASVSLVGCSTGCPKGTVQIDEECQRFSLAGNGGIVTGVPTGSLDSGVTRADAEPDAPDDQTSHDAGVDSGKPSPDSGTDSGAGPKGTPHGGAGSVAPPASKPESGKGGVAGTAGEPPAPTEAGSGGKPPAPIAAGAGAGGKPAPVVVVPTGVDWFCMDGMFAGTCVCIESPDGVGALDSCTRPIPTCCYMVPLESLPDVVSCVCATPTSTICAEMVANPAALKQSTCPPPAGS